MMDETVFGIAKYIWYETKVDVCGTKGMLHLNLIAHKKDLSPLGLELVCIIACPEPDEDPDPDDALIDISAAGLTEAEIKAPYAIHVNVPAASIRDIFHQIQHGSQWLH
ncbi:hypothetical protein WN944_000441 [Citrus x changshan-huyou]|uniref:Uncharacterized protein n=1 Tax=Citrus x changshan-huyou TaxID=2935761 RepID=A0AAP0MCW0_9ROSI